jgi:protease-4
MKRILLFLITALTVAAPAAAFAPNGWWEPPATGAAGSVAVADDALSVPVNPAGLAAGHGLNLYFNRHVQSDLGARDWHLYADTVLGGFGYAHYNDPTANVKSSRFTWNYAYPIWRWAGAGVGINRLAASKPYLTSAWTVDAGLLLRPSEYLSVGFTAKNLNEPRFLRQVQGRNYVLGLGVRPGFDRVTVSADVNWTEDDTDFDELGYRFGVDVEPLDGLVLRAGFDDEETISAGVSFGFVHGAAGYDAAFDTDGNYLRDSAFVYLNAERKRSALDFAGDYAVFELSGKLSEEGTPWNILGNSTVNVRGLKDDMENARKDRDVKGVIIRMGDVDPGFSTGISALTREIRAEVEKIRADGKPVYCYVEYMPTTSAYYIASACDYVMMPEVGVIATMGTQMTMWRATGFTERYGVEWDYMTAGDYKGSLHLFGDEPTDRDYEQIKALVDESYHIFVRDCSAARGLDEAAFRALVEGEPISPPEAVELGLIDGVGDYQDFKAYVAGLEGEGADALGTTNVAGRRYWKRKWSEAAKVRVIIAAGGVSFGESRHSVLTGSRTIGIDTVVAQLIAARKDPNVGAIVLRIDSPGGAGSQAMFKEVVRTREAGKPVVVSMGDVAASAGYHMAAAADRIYADESTITGSIGVVFLKPVLEEFYEKYGIERYPVKSHEHTDALSYHRHWTEEEEGWAEEAINRHYNIFLDDVSRGRGIEKSELEPLAGGRIYTGARAEGLGLIDDTGTLDDAIAYARTAAGLPEDAPVEYVGYSYSFWRDMFGGMSSGLKLGEILTR